MELNSITKRFIDIYDEIILRGFARNQADFAKKVESYGHIVNVILKGERNLTLNMINNLVRLEGVNGEKINLSYLVSASDDPFILKGAEKVIQELSSDLKEDRIKLLEATLQDQKQEITLLKTKVEMLEKMMDLQRQINETWQSKSGDGSSPFQEGQDREAV